MELNADFNERVFVHAAKLPWKASPMPGVERRMLDRLGNEIARATTIVRYAPKSSSPARPCGRRGVLRPRRHLPGRAWRLPCGQLHPQSTGIEAHAQIRIRLHDFVKLWQFDLADRKHVRIDTNKMTFISDAERAGVEIMPLFRDALEDVRLERWAAGATIALDASAGMEILVLAGSFSEGGEAFEPQSWLRLPKCCAAQVKVGANGARVWIKRGHLVKTPRAPA